MSSDPTETSKYVLVIWNGNDPLFFDTAEDVAKFLTKEAMTEDLYGCYEIAKEVHFKLVPA